MLYKEKSKMIDQPDKEEPVPVEADSIEPAVEAAKKVLDLAQADDKATMEPKSGEALREELMRKVKEGFSSFAKQGELVEDDDPTKYYWNNEGTALRSGWDVRLGETTGDMVIERRFNDSTFSATEDFGFSENDPPLKGVNYSFRNDGESWADDWGEKRGKYVPQLPGGDTGVRQLPGSRPINDEEMIMLSQVHTNIVPTDYDA